MTPENLKKIFSAAIPEDRLRADDETLEKYSRDTTECRPGRPDLVAFLESPDLAEAMKEAGISRMGEMLTLEEVDKG